MEDKGPATPLLMMPSELRDHSHDRSLGKFKRSSWPNADDCSGPTPILATR